MGAATVLATTHLPQAAYAGGLYRDSEAGVWSRQSSQHVHGVRTCTAGVVRADADNAMRLVPAQLAIAWRRLPCRRCLPQGILAALRAGKLPAMETAASIRAARPNEIRAAVLGRLQSGVKCTACRATGERVHPYTHVVVDCEPCDGTGYLPPGSEGA